MEYQDFERCKKCGGKCCAIYEENIWCIDCGSFREWRNLFHRKTRQYHKRPLFNPLKAWQLRTEEKRLQYRNELIAKGINPEMCEYWDKDTGCIISWENRPAKCKEFICNDWKKELESSNKGLSI